MKTKAHRTQRQSRYRLELGQLEGTLGKKDLSVPSDRMGEPTREGVRAAVLRLRRGHAGDDTLDTSRVFWVNRWNDERKENDDDKTKREKKTSKTRSRL